MVHIPRKGTVGDGWEARVKYLIIVPLAVMLLGPMPFVFVWALNTAFHTSFAITSFEEWFAVLLVLMMVGSKSR